MQRWQKLGCWIQLMAPFLAAAAGLAVIGILRLLAGIAPGVVEGVDGVPEADAAEHLMLGGVALAVGLVVAGVVVFVIRHYAGRSPGPPPAAELVAPQSGLAQLGAPRPPGVASVAADLGPVADTQIRLEEWHPPQSIRLRQVGAWGWGPLVLAALVPLVVFVGVPSLETGVLQGERAWHVGVPDPFLVGLGVWLAMGFLWLSLPSRPRSVHVDAGRDTIELRYGRRHRELGLSRLRGVERREHVTARRDGDSQAQTSTTYHQQIVAWIEPRGAAPVPYLLVEDGGAPFRKAEKRRPALQQLADDLARALGVPARRPDDAEGEEPFH